MALSDFFGIVRRRWLVVGAVTLAGLALAAAYVSSLPTTYVSSSRLYVSMATGTSVNDSYQGGLASQQRVTSYVYIATGSTVAQRVIDDLGLTMSPAELQSKVTATFPPATMLIDISVADSTPEGARRLTEAVAAQFSQLVGEMETTRQDAAPLAEATVVDAARTPTQPEGPDARRILAIGLIAGLGLGCAGAFARDRLGGTVRTPDDIGRALGGPVLVTIPDDSVGATRSVAQLRAHVISTHAGRGRMVLMFTSFSERSSPCAALRLAKALADTGRRVVLVDADITGGGSSARLGMTSGPGLSEWLRGLHTPVEELPRWHGTEVSVLPLGSVDERTPDHVASTQIADLLSLLRDHFDYIIVDAAPVLADPAALTLSAHCDATVAVVDVGTRSTSVRSATAAFRASASGLLGAVGIAGTCAGVPPETRPKGHPRLASDEQLVHTRTPRS